MQTTTSRPASGTQTYIRATNQFGLVEHMPRAVFEAYFDGLGWDNTGAIELTDHQLALIRQATPEVPGDPRWMRLPEFSGHDDVRALFGLSDVGLAYRSGELFLLTAAGRAIHKQLTGR